MNYMSKKISVFLLIGFITLACSQESRVNVPGFPEMQGHYFGRTAPGIEPVPFPMDFLPETVYLHSAPAFTPDGNEVYFSVFIKNVFRGERIMYMKRNDNGRWTNPEMATFSGEYFEGGPCVTPDGNRIFYSSARPIASGGEEKEDRDIWYVDRTETGWSEPIRTNFNTGTWEDVPYVSEPGYLYYKSDNDIYRVKMIDSGFSGPERLSNKINSEYGEQHPCIAPDESYMIFYSSRPGHLGDNNGDLYISFKNESGEWSEPVNMGPEINKGHVITRFPRLSPDGKYLFFSKVVSMYNDQIYWVDIRYIETLR
ncbi:TolB family protein [candidate division KSB1 bacterium]